jgi:hypothetical protein
MIYIGVPDFGLPVYSIPDFSIQMMGEGGDPPASGMGGYYFMLLAYGII